MTNLKKLLTRLNACEEAVSFANGKELSEAWLVCDRADWMLWLVGIMAGNDGWPTRKQIIAVACSIAEDVLPIFEKKHPDEKRVRKCLETICAYLRDEATIEDVQKARRAADAAAAAAAAAVDAAAAHAAVDAAAHAAWTYARDTKLKEYANLVRRELKIPVEVAQ